MRQHSFFKGIFVVCVCTIAIVYLSENLIKDTKFPSLGEYLASTTSQLQKADDSILAASASDANVTGASSTDSGADQLKTVSIQTPGGSIQVLVAETPDEQEKGLGDRLSLPEDDGMLFPFDSPGIYGFWMKDMHFPIDMVWIDSNKNIVGTASDVATSTFPNIFLPPSPISYVLELNAGASIKLGIATGTRLVIGN